MKPSQETKPNLSIKYGDIFSLGEHRIACGDSCDAGLVSALLGDERVALICADAPYGVSYASSKVGLNIKIAKEKEIQNDHDQTDEQYCAFTKAWLDAIVPHMAKKNAAYLFNADKMIFAMREGMLDAGMTFTQLLVWVKHHAVIGRLDYIGQHELIAYGWYGTHKFFKSKDKSVIVYPKPSKSALHPTMKPVGLLRRMILNSSQVGDIVYDAFLGSFSTVIACEDTMRRCYGVEIDPEYVAVGIERFEKKTGIKAVKIMTYAKAKAK